MKAERRHELQHNELADWLADAIQRVKPYSRAIAGLVLAAAVLLIVYVVLSQRALSKQSTAWNDYYLAIQSPSKEGAEADLEAVVRSHEGAVAGLWARVALADLQLGEGIGAFFTDKRTADRKLTSAIENYEAVLAKAEDPLLAARAKFGLARAQESRGKLDAARVLYEEIVQAPDSDAYVPAAKARLADLNRESTRDFYAWFAEQEPSAAPDLSLPGAPGERLPFDSSSLGRPGDVNLSGDNILNIPGLNKGTSGPLLTPDAKKEDANEGEKESAKDSESADKGGAEPARKTGASKEKKPDQTGDAKSESKEATPPKGDPQEETSKAESGKADNSGDPKT
jgi:tetratricopeptide (TPR) repeat protein